jgi:NAD-dependent DNA ligase
MGSQVDDHGQPLSPFIRGEDRSNRQISEMLGTVKGVLFDGVISEAEAQHLNAWMTANPDASLSWPGEVIANRLRTIFADGIVSPEEREDLRDLLEQIAGGKTGFVSKENMATTFPLDRPQPSLDFQRKLFVFTGKFAFGPRKTCQEMTVQAGGECADNVSHKVDYLVIGTFSSRDWIQSSYGRKIEKAVEYRTERKSLAIISEDHWAAALPKS